MKDIYTDVAVSSRYVKYKFVFHDDHIQANNMGFDTNVTDVFCYELTKKYQYIYLSWMMMAHPNSVCVNFFYSSIHMSLHHRHQLHRDDYVCWIHACQILHSPLKLAFVRQNLQ
ncbi:hypothetical protein YC2023_060768 [Brassica napus]